MRVNLVLLLLSTRSKEVFGGMMLKLWIAMIVLLAVVSARADLFDGEDKPLFLEPSVVRYCGKRVRMVSMRGTIQPNLARLGEKLIMLSSENQHDVEGQVNLTLPYLPKLAKRLKKNPVIKVIFTEKGIEPLKQEIGVELTTCLIEGKPFDEWMN